MAYRWPLLDVYDVSDSEALIEKCLEPLSGLSLLECLKARNITVISMRPLLLSGMMIYADAGFCILLDSEILDNDIHCLTTAHELAHTFELDLDTRQRLTELTDEGQDASEEFAEAFAHRWMSKPKRVAELRSFLEHHFPRPFEHKRVYLREIASL